MENVHFYFPLFEHFYIDIYNYENPRKLQVYFYYPSDEYVSYLMTVEELMFLDEVDCRDLFAGNDRRERIIVFELGGE